MNTVNYPKLSVGFIHWSNRDRNQMHLGKIANSECLLKSLLNNQIHPNELSKLFNTE